MDVLSAVRSNLTPDLLSKKWVKSHGYDPSNPMAGHCYVASEALYHLGYGAKGYKPQVMRHQGGTHWYLRIPGTDAIIDPTADQFDIAPNYSQGRGSGFLTNKPSKRCAVLLSRVRNGENWVAAQRIPVAPK